MDTKQTVNPNPPNYSSLPISQVEIERGIIAAALVERSAMEKIRLRLDVEDFSSLDCRIIFRAIQKLPTDADIDIYALHGVLKQTPAPSPYLDGLSYVGGIQGLSSFLNYPPMLYLDQAIDQLLEMVTVRQLTKLTQKAVDDIQQGRASTAEAVSACLAEINRYQHRCVRQQSQHIDQVTLAALAEMECLAKGGKSESVSYTLPEVDMATGGMRKQELIILLAPPKTGKTTFALQVALTAASRGIRTVYHSLEVSPMSLAKRALAWLSTRVPYGRIATGKLTEEDVEHLRSLSSFLGQSDLRFLDGAIQTFSDLRSACLNEFQGFSGRRLVVCDYLQLYRPETYSRSAYETVTYLSAEAKRLASSLDCPVFCVSSVNRASYEQIGLGAAKGSGSIEYDANIVMAIEPREPVNGEVVSSSMRPVKIRSIACRDAPPFEVDAIFDAANQQIRQLQEACNG